VYLCTALEGMMIMNWIILILAGLCEVGFTFCLGRSKAVAGYEWWTWIAGFAALYVLSALLLAEFTSWRMRKRN
jgi:quaternary ammonium compound-resistance protein SugE